MDTRTVRTIVIVYLCVALFAYHAITLGSAQARADMAEQRARTHTVIILIDCEGNPCEQ